MLFQLDIENEDEEPASTETDLLDSPGDKRKRSKSKKQKKKYNTQMLIKSILEDKAREKSISRKIHDVLDGVDSEASAKMTFGNWIASQMPRINNKRFMQYATDIQHHTFNQILLSEADEAQANTPPRPQQPPSSPGTPAAGRFQPDPVHHTPPNVGSSQQHLTPMMPPSQPFQSLMNVPQQPGPYQHHSMSQQHQYHQQGYGVSQSSNFQQPAVYGVNRQLQHTHQLQAGQIAPQFLPNDLSQQSTASVTTDPDGRTFQQMQPASLSHIQRLSGSSWETQGPERPRAVPQQSPQRSIQESVGTLIKDGRAQVPPRKKIKVEKVEEQSSADSDYQIDEGDASET